MSLLSAEQLWRKYGQFADMSSMYRLIREGVAAGVIKKEEIKGKGGDYTVAGYCELCFCKHVFANRTKTYYAKIFAHNVGVISKRLATESRVAVS